MNLECSIFRLLNFRLLAFFNYYLNGFQEPIEVSGLEKKVDQISTGYYHSAAITGWELLGPLIESREIAVSKFGKP